MHREESCYLKMKRGAERWTEQGGDLSVFHVTLFEYILLSLCHSDSIFTLMPGQQRRHQPRRHHANWLLWPEIPHSRWATVYRQTRQRYVLHKQRLIKHTPANTQAWTKSPSKALYSAVALCNTMHVWKYINTHTHPLSRHFESKASKGTPELECRW